MKDAPAARPMDQPNIYPIDWRVEDPRFMTVYEKAKAKVWNPSDLPWDELADVGLDDDERVGVAYLSALLAMFEYAAAPQFALPLHHLYEHHEEHGAILLCMATTRDEFIHEEVARRTAQALIPGFPFDREPASDLERLAIDNLRWVEYKQGRMWATYRDRILDGKNPWLAHMSIWAPEITGMVLFRAVAKRSKIPFLAQAYANVDRDEVRHVAYGRLLFEKGVKKGLSKDDLDRLVKVCSDGILYAGGMLQFPRLVEESDFWQTPFDEAPGHFASTHRTLIEGALRILTDGMSTDEMFEAARDAVLKVRHVLEHNGADVQGSDLPVWRTFNISKADRSLEEDYSLEALA